MKSQLGAKKLHIFKVNALFWCGLAAFFDEICDEGQKSP